MASSSIHLRLIIYSSHCATGNWRQLIFSYWDLFLSHAWTWCQHNCLFFFVNMKAQPLWTMKGNVYAWVTHIKVAWNSLLFKCKVVAADRRHTYLRESATNNLSDKMYPLSAFSLCFALISPFLCVSLSSTILPSFRSLLLSHASRIISAFSFDAEHFTNTPH